MNLNSKHIIYLSRLFFAESDSGVTVRKKSATLGCIVVATLISLSVFPPTVRLIITMFMFVPIFSVPLSHYFLITSNLLFCSLNINKVSKQHTCVLSRSSLGQVPGLSNWCNFALANDLAGIFISCY